MLRTRFHNVTGAAVRMDGVETSSMTHIKKTKNGCPSEIDKVARGAVQQRAWMFFLEASLLMSPHTQTLECTI